MNTQNIPNDSYYRECFEGQEDNLLITSDYSQQEIAVVADRANEVALIEAINNKEDIHSVVGTRLFTAFYKKPFLVSKDTPVERYRAKTTQFRVLYGTGASTLAEEFGITTKEAQKIIDSYWEGFPAVYNYINKERTFALINGYSILDDVTNGRRVYDKYPEFKSLQTKVNSFVSEFGEEGFFSSLEAKVEPINSIYRRAKMLRADIEREAGNCPIQGGSSSMTKYAGILFRRKLLLHKISPLSHDIRLINKIHDELVIEAAPEYVDLAKQLIKDAMTEAANMFLNKVNMVVEPGISKEWKK